MYLDTELTYFPKMNSQWMDGSVKLKTWKFLKENIGGNLDDLAFGNEFLDTTWKAWSMKKKIKYKSWKFDHSDTTCLYLFILYMI